MTTSKEAFEHFEEAITDVRIRRIKSYFDFLRESGVVRSKPKLKIDNKVNWKKEGF